MSKADERVPAYGVWLAGAENPETLAVRGATVRNSWSRPLVSCQSRLHAVVLTNRGSRVR